MADTQSKFDLPLTIDWLPHNQAAVFLGIHESQYRRDLSLLDKLGLIDRRKYGRGIDRNILEILKEFRELVNQRGRYEAAKQLIQRGNNG